MKIRDKFRKKLYAEYKAFKRRTLRGSKRSIYYQGYMIEIIINFYEILLEKSETLSEDVLHRLISQPQLLMSLYERWLKKEDGAYVEMLLHIDDEIEKIMYSPVPAERIKYGNKRNSCT